MLRELKYRLPVFLICVCLLVTHNNLENLRPSSHRHAGCVTIRHPAYTTFSCAVHLLPLLPFLPQIASVCDLYCCDILSMYNAKPSQSLI